MTDTIGVEFPLSTMRKGLLFLCKMKELANNLNMSQYEMEWFLAHRQDLEQSIRRIFMESP